MSGSRCNGGDYLTNFSSDSQGSLPPPTSIEAIVNPVSHTEDLPADSRLASVKNWTAVQSSTHFLVNLLTAWTDREYIYYHYLDREAFLDDMASGRSDFCSTLLVNALLASACVRYIIRIAPLDSSI